MTCDGEQAGGGRVPEDPVYSRLRGPFQVGEQIQLNNSETSGIPATIWNTSSPARRQLPTGPGIAPTDFQVHLQPPGQVWWPLGTHGPPFVTLEPCDPVFQVTGFWAPPSLYFTWALAVPPFPTGCWADRNKSYKLSWYKLRLCQALSHA